MVLERANPVAFSAGGGARSAARRGTSPLRGFERDAGAGDQRLGVFGDIDRAAAHMAEALDWDQTHANGYTNKATHAAALAQVQVRAGLVALRASVLDEKDDIRRERTANGLANR